MLYRKCILKIRLSPQLQNERWDEKRTLRRETNAWIQPVTHFFHGKYLLNYLLHQTLFICWESKFRVLLRRAQKTKKNVKRVLWNFPSNMGKNALQLLLYQKIWNAREQTFLLCTDWRDPAKPVKTLIFICPRVKVLVFWIEMPVFCPGFCPCFTITKR